MKPEITILKNGLRIVTAEMREAQSVTCSIFVGVGGRYERFDDNGGVSHFLEHLLFKGTPKRPTAKIIAEEIDAVGGWNNAYTSNDLTNYYVKVPKQHAKMAIDILCDMVQNATLDPEEVDRERDVIVEEMSVWRDDPSRYVGTLLPPLLWPNDPLSYEILGSEQVIRSIPRDVINEYKAKHYTASNLVVSVAGNITHDRVVKQVTELLGGLAGGDKNVAPGLTNELSSELTNVHEQDTNQAHFLIGCRAYPYNHPDDPAARVITNILGRGMSSRLFTNVRERKGLAYHVYASSHNFVDTGMFEAYAGVNPDKIDEAIEAVMEELQLIREQPVTEAELNKAKQQTRGALQMAIESNSNVSERMGTQLTLLNEIKGIEEQLEEIDAVSVEDVKRVAARMLEPKNLRMAMIAPSGASGVERFKQLVKRST